MVPLLVPSNSPKVATVRRLIGSLQVRLARNLDIRRQALAMSIRVAWTITPCDNDVFVLTDVTVKWTCPGFVDTWVRLLVLRGCAAARTPGD
jgi:hypothetical protein